MVTSFLPTNVLYLLAACGETPYYYYFPDGGEDALHKALGIDIPAELDYFLVEKPEDATQFGFLDAMTVVTSASEIGILEIVQPVALPECTVEGSAYAHLPVGEI